MWKFMIAALAIPVVAAAQPRPGAFTTLTTTDTSANSLNVGCQVGTPACTGGVRAGAGTFDSLRTTGADAILLEPTGPPTNVVHRLYNLSGTLYFNGAAVATGSSLSGSTNRIAKFTGVSSVGNSSIIDDGASMAITAHVSIAGNLAVAGSGGFRDGVYAGPSNNPIVNAQGKIPAISSQYFSDLSGLNLTGIAASTLANGTHSGVYNFNNTSNQYSGSGAALTGLNASELIYGTVPAARGGVPSGMVAYFYAGGCPTGWTDMSTTWGGYYFVTMGPGWTLGAGVGGPPLTHQEARAVGWHSHTVTVNLNDGGHDHSVPNVGDIGQLTAGSDWFTAGTGGGRTGGSGSNISVTSAKANEVGSAGIPAPYVQLLTCMKQ